MRAFTSSLAVAALLLNGAIAGSFQKRAIFNEALKDNHVQSATPSSTASASVASASPKADPKTVKAAGSTVDVLSRLTSFGFKNMGQNAKANNGQCWLGTDGANTNLVKNGASESIIVVLWGAMGSWMTDAAKPPLITVGLAPGESTTISCGDVTGGIAAIYSNTKMSPFGQIDQTWVEFTFGTFGTVDVSKEVNMSGNPISVVGSKCTTDMSTCVFECKSGNTCMEAGSYILKNCSPANGGHSDDVGMNGGCLMGPNAHLTTTFS